MCGFNPTRPSLRPSHRVNIFTGNWLISRVKRIVLISLIPISAVAAWLLWFNRPVDYITEVKPLLNKKCIACHGGVRRKGGFSLLFREDALAPTESGTPAIIPGQPENSEVIRRITHADPEERMPYKHEPLSEKEIDLLTRWIREGAAWGDHWAYTPVTPHEAPKPPFWDLAGKHWAASDIDRFILEKMREHKLEPSPEADPNTLLRRVSLDLIGLPAPEPLAKKFLSHPSPVAYEILVDELLASPHFGERWAAPWLDLARYADTKGYERDYLRTIWRYRDWLIHAFNRDMPYNRFITEQLAGDLLPDPTDDQLLATAFHRNTMTNDEGGTDNEEFRTAAVLDRVNTTWEALLGTTFACTQCHSHPYDPFRHEDYYRFMAFFNNTRDEDTYDDYPLLREFKKEDSASLAKIVAWVGEPRGQEIQHFLKTGQPAVNSLVSTPLVNSALSDTKWLLLRNKSTARLATVDLTGKDHLIFRFASWKPKGTAVFHLDSEQGPELGSFTAPETKGEWSVGEIPLKKISGSHTLFVTYSNPLLKDMRENGIMFDWLYFTQEFPGKGRPGHEEAQAAFRKLISASTTNTPIMMENPPDMARKTFVFTRGNWLDKGNEVSAGTPPLLNPFPDKAPANRLGLAQWMIDDKNPLTARTIVNRVWEQLFGTGLCETLEDMGTQGMPPSHPELLDHLAWQFTHDDQWRLKALIRKIVLSSTYKQSAIVSPEAQAYDPANRYLSHSPRVRLSAEQVRDKVLAVSGLLSEKMYGPGVMPYQPDGIWQSPYNGLTWIPSKGEDKYRRALYTYWKRTAPYPSMILFDGNTREVCAARRIRTNTPLQALVTLNDSVYIEAAGALALRMREHADSPSGQIRYGYERAMGKPITPAREAALLTLYEKTSRPFQKTSRTKETPVDWGLVLVANAILNLDEFLTKD